MKRGFRRLWSCERGAAMVEMTLVAPMLIFLTSGIIQFGYIFFIQNTMQNLARDAARGVAVGELTASGSNVDCPGGAVGSAEEMACAGLAGFSGNFTVNATNPPDPGDDVIVTISLPMVDAAVMDVLGVLDEGTISAEATMRKE
ncbi:MAG: TadE family protein [Dongiaceae bacterium]